MAELRRMAERYRTPIGVLVVLALIGLGFAALEHLTQEIRFADVRAALHGLSAGKIALALLATAGSYLALTFYGGVRHGRSCRRQPVPGAGRARGSPAAGRCL